MPDSEAPERIPQPAGSGRIARFDSWWLLVFVVVSLLTLLILGKPDPYGRIARFVTDGMWVTVRITLVSFVLILVLGLVGGMGRISKNPIIYGAASLYIEVIRGIPLLVQLIFIYYASPQLLRAIGEALVNSVPVLSGLGQALIGIRLNPFVAAVFGLTFCYGAYMSEIYRAGIESIPKGQMEAARSLGMSYFQSMRYIILPQAGRVILPPVGNEFVALLKDSSLVSAVAVADLTRRGREFMSSTLLSLETWTLVALIYLVMTLFASRVVSYVERKFSSDR